VFRAKHSLLRRFFEYWLAHGEIAELPMPLNRPPQRSTFLPYIYSREELRRLLRLAPSCSTSNDKIHPKTLRTILLMLYATGTGVGEVTALVNDAIDLQNGLVTFGGNQRTLSRTIPIGKDLIRVVQQYVRWRKKTGSNGDFLFSRMDGEGISPPAVMHNFERLRKKAGITGYRESSQKPCIRDIRATFAVHQITSWIKKSRDLNVMLPALGAYMGTIGLESTERYLRLTPQRFQDALNILSPRKQWTRWQNDPALLEFLTSL